MKENENKPVKKQDIAFKAKQHRNKNSKDECFRKVKKGKRNARRKSKIKVMAKPNKDKQ